MSRTQNISKDAQYTYIKLWEIIENLCEFVMVILLGELDFPHVELSNSSDLIMPMDHSWCFTLRLWKDDIHEILERND